MKRFSCMASVYKNASFPRQMAQCEATIIQELYYKGIMNPQTSTRSRCTLLACSMHARALIGSVAGAHAHCSGEQEVTLSRRRGQRTHMYMYMYMYMHLQRYRVHNFGADRRGIFAEGLSIDRRTWQHEKGNSLWGETGR